MNSCTLLTCILYYIFNAGSGILGISIGLNAVSTHALCTAVFVVIAAIPGFLFSSIRTLGKITWLAWVGLPCILTASMFFSAYPLSTETPPERNLTFSSSHCYHRRWYSRSSCGCTARRMGFRLQSRRQSRFY